MANKKTTETDVKDVEEILDPEELVDIRVPRGEKDEEKTYHIFINDRDWHIPMGKTFKVPRYVKEEYDRCMRAKDRYMDIVDELVEESTFQD